MSTVKVIQIVSTSPDSFEDAIRQGVAEASKTLRGISGVRVTHWTADVENNEVQQFRTTLEVAFRLDQQSQA